MEIIMNIIKVILMSIFSIIELFLITKIIGNRQMSELNMFDYINGITIGSIAAEMATSLENDMTAPMTAMIVYGLITVLISALSSKSIAARRILVGKSIILFKNNKLYRNNMKVAKLDMNELTAQCRINGYFDFSEIDTIILEANGKFSILPKSQYRPLTPSDSNIEVKPASIQPSIIIDGCLLEENLKHIGKDTTWVNQQLKNQKISNKSDVFYAFFDSTANALTVFKKLPDKKKNDLFI
ncbi:MAG: DUF421 domain-containing protein [Clostridia bacterium]|nr:DUF421 domain-containing protein [Clostridia bacterium]